MVEEIELSRQLEYLKSLVKKRDWQYYHIEAIENFIFHLSSIKDEKLRRGAKDGIQKLLELAMQKVDEQESLGSKGKAIGPTVFQVANAYKLEVGFIQKPSLFVFFILIVSLYFLLTLTLSRSHSLLACLSVAIVYWVYGIIKIRAKKVY